MYLVDLTKEKRNLLLSEYMNRKHENIGVTIRQKNS